MADYNSLSDEDLDAAFQEAVHENEQLKTQAKQIRESRLELSAQIDAMGHVREARRKIAKMDPAERAALSQTIAAQGIPSSESVNGPR